MGGESVVVTTMDVAPPGGEDMVADADAPPAPLIEGEGVALRETVALTLRLTLALGETVRVTDGEKEG